MSRELTDAQPLFDIVESNQLVIFTGAGFSRDFKGRDGQPLPGWKALLQKVQARMRREGVRFSTLSGIPADVLLQTFFDEEFPRGEHLIEAATILRRARPRLFDRLVNELLTPDPDQAADDTAAYAHKHKALLALEPRGIVTVNVDRFHEEFLKSARLGRKWRTHDPVNESDAGATQIVQTIGETRFLIKAHGTIGRKIVFDYDAYRDLLEKTPTYTALFSHLFSHYRMLFIGFSLTDLDFDFLTDTAVRRFGSPLQQHLTLQIRKGAPRTARARIEATLVAARAARLRERFGIRTLEIDAGDVLPLLEKAAKTPGARLNCVIEQCLSRNIHERRRAHSELKLLGTAGKRVAMQVIYERVRAALAPGADRPNVARLRDLSELTYSLGEIDPSDRRDRRRLASNLLDIVQSSSDAEIVAHALWALVSLVESADLPHLRRIKRSGHLDRLTRRRGFHAPPGRCHQYLDALIARVAAEKQ